jgi:hypothetical protein
VGAGRALQCAGGTATRRKLGGVIFQYKGLAVRCGGCLKGCTFGRLLATDQRLRPLYGAALKKDHRGCVGTEC